MAKGSRKGKSSGGGAGLADEESKKKLPSVGKKVHDAFIDYVKKQINLDLSKARDTQFDNRNGFNIDTRKLSRNDLANLKNLTNKYPGGYQVNIMSNGVNRQYIQVKRKK